MIGGGGVHIKLDLQIQCRGKNIIIRALLFEIIKAKEGYSLETKDFYNFFGKGASQYQY